MGALARNLELGILYFFGQPAGNFQILRTQLWDSFLFVFTAAGTGSTAGPFRSLKALAPMSPFTLAGNLKAPLFELRHIIQTLASGIPKEIEIGGEMHVGLEGVTVDSNFQFVRRRKEFPPRFGN